MKKHIPKPREDPQLNSPDPGGWLERVGDRVARSHKWYSEGRQGFGTEVMGAAIIAHFSQCPSACGLSSTHLILATFLPIETPAGIQLFYHCDCAAMINKSFGK